MQVKYVATLEQEGPGVAFSAPKLEHLVELVLNRPPHMQHTHTRTILSRNDILRHFNRYSTHAIIGHRSTHYNTEDDILQTRYAHN
jgi:hypothetical protein